MFAVCYLQNLRVIARSRETNACGYFCLLTANIFNVLSCFCTTIQPCVYFFVLSAYFFSLSKNLLTYQATRLKHALNADFGRCARHCSKAIINYSSIRRLTNIKSTNVYVSKNSNALSTKNSNDYFAENQLKII